jgi:hypothetical protein
MNTQQEDEVTTRKLLSFFSPLLSKNVTLVPVIVSVPVPVIVVCCEDVLDSYEVITLI